MDNKLPSDSFTSKYKVSFNEEQNCWRLNIPKEDARQARDGSYEVRLPAYACYVLQPAGNILRPRIRKYREFLLQKQGGVCAICGQGPRANDYFCLDHQPPMADPDSRTIDYAGTTANRVIHKSCDPAQNKKQTAIEPKRLQRIARAAIAGNATRLVEEGMSKADADALITKAKELLRPA